MKKLMSIAMFLTFAAFLFAQDKPAEIKKIDVSLNNGYSIGDVATDFTLMDVTGEKVSMSDYPDAKGYVIIFTCNHCPYSVFYEDRIIRMHYLWASKGYPVIAINPNDPEVQPKDSYELMKERAVEKAFPFPYLYDEGQKIYPEYGATKTPHVYILDQDKKVRYIGAIDDNAKDEASVNKNFVNMALAALQNGTEISTNYTKAIGCSIKSKKK